MSSLDKSIKHVTKVWIGIVSILLFAVLINILVNLYGFSIHLHWSETTPAVVFAVLVSVLAGRHAKGRSNANMNTATFFTICILTMLPFLFVAVSFGNATLGAILFTLQANAPQDLFRVGFNDFPTQATEVIVYAVIAVFAPRFLLKRVLFFRPLFIILTLIGITFHPITSGIYEYLIPNKNHRLLTIQSYMPPVKVLASPANPKNVIHIYLESVERTYAQIPSAKTAFRYFHDLEQRGLTFTNVGQVFGTDYTAAGLVASQCGAPLLPNGMNDLKNKIWQNKEKDFGSDKFMSNVTCLGDVLKSHGYNLSYINGSDLRIFSKGEIFSSHGYDHVFGINSLANAESEPRQNVWGLDDEFLFEKAKSEIDHLKDLGKPFVLTMLTLSTHGPDAFLDATCDNTKINDSLIPAAIECTANHINDLIIYLEQQGLMQDTIVILQSDHLAMRNTLASELGQYSEESRKNLFTILGADYSGQYDKAGAAVDIFPTILEVLGFKIADNTAHLGRSLISAKPTLAQSLGLETLSAAFANNRDLQQRLWGR